MKFDYAMEKRGNLTMNKLPCPNLLSELGLFDGLLVNLVF